MYNIRVKISKFRGRVRVRVGIEIKGWMSIIIRVRIGEE